MTRGMKRKEGPSSSSTQAKAPVLNHVLGKRKARKPEGPNRAMLQAQESRKQELQRLLQAQEFRKQFLKRLLRVQQAKQALAKKPRGSVVRDLPSS